MTDSVKQLEPFHYAAHTDGAHVLITGRIHGDEPAGELAIRQLIKALDSGALALTKGTLTLLPVLNPLAAAANVRGVEINMNRNLTPELLAKAPDCPEEALQQELVQIFHAEQKHAGKAPWYHLDIHSVPLPGAPHVILSGKTEVDFALAAAIGLPDVYTNWQEAYLAAEPADIVATGHAGDRAAYERQFQAAIYATHKLGSTVSLCLEAGSNTDPAATDCAYQAILNLLAYAGLIEAPAAPPLPVSALKVTQFEKAIFRRDESEHLVGISRDAEPLTPGQVILQGNSRSVKVPETKANWVIGHPIPNARVGGKIALLAQRL